MEHEAAYPAARIVSPKVYAYFARQRTEAAAGGIVPATLPDIPAIQAMVDAAFWASLRREESFVPKVSLAYVSPAQTKNALLLEHPLALDPGSLTKVAPAVERPGIHLGVWPGPDGGLLVWGATRAIPKLCLVVEVAAAGLIVIKHHSSETKGKFVNVAVLEGDQVKVIDGRSANVSDCPALLTELLGSESPANWVTSLRQAANVLVQLAVSMRGHGRGGSLLVVPALDGSWRESIVSPISYAVSPPFGTLAELARASNGDNAPLNRAIDAVAGLTAVDGAVVLTDHYEVLAFGVKIARRRGYDPVEQVMVSEPIEGGQAILVHPEKLGGTRHLSAAQFVQDQHGSAALVASQDGRFTVFEWSECESMVRAHRIEALLL
jgi:hypothetical protein